MAKILVIRTSSFGDVAMLVPVIYSVAAKYPQDRFTVLTRKAFAPLFENLGFNIGVTTFDPNSRHKGPLGLFRLLHKINTGKYSYVADVHDVIRSKMIRYYMALLGKRTAYVDKGRAEKTLMIESKKTTPPLQSTISRYMQVFEELGFPAEISFTNFFEFREKSLYPLRNVVPQKNGYWVGIAPFSKHPEKVYPLAQMKRVINLLSQNPTISVFLFGSGNTEKRILDDWSSQFPNVYNITGKINLDNEILLISYLDTMISMDSANMHLASLVQVPVVSIWGATHPNLGFYGFGQDPNNAIQTDISCRPCSVYGDIPCQRKDFACLTRIKEESIVAKVMEILHKKDSEIETNTTDAPASSMTEAEDHHQIETNEQESAAEVLSSEISSPEIKENSDIELSVQNINPNSKDNGRDERRIKGKTYI